MKTRIYVAVNKRDGAERLVRALSKSRALRGCMEVRIASQDDLQRLLASGVVVENDPPAMPLAHRPRRAA